VAGLSVAGTKVQCPRRVGFRSLRERQPRGGREPDRPGYRLVLPAAQRRAWAGPVWVRRRKASSSTSLSLGCASSFSARVISRRSVVVSFQS